MRMTAWIFFALAIGFPALVLWNVYQEGAVAVARGEQLCGMPLFVAYLTCFFTLVLVGGLAAAFAWMGYRDGPKPRRLLTKVEAWFLSLPFITGVGLVTYTFLWFRLHSGR